MPDATSILVRPNRSRRSGRTSGAGPARALPADRHHRLVALLTGMQLAVGLLAAALVATAWLPPNDIDTLVTASAVVLAVGLLASRRAERKPGDTPEPPTPWLGHEILTFGALAALTVAYLASAWVEGPAAESSEVFGTVGVVLGLVAVGCSAMTYHATGERLWHVASSGSQFLGTTAVLGAGALALVSSAEAVRPLAAACAGTLVAVTTLKLLGLHAWLRFEAGRDALPLVRTTRLLRGRLRPLLALRVVTGVLGGIVLPVLNAAGGGIPFVAMLALELSILGEGTERTLFFRAISPPRLQPGL